MSKSEGSHRQTKANDARQTDGYKALNFDVANQTMQPVVVMNVKVSNDRRCQPRGTVKGEAKPAVRVRKSDVEVVVDQRKGDDVDRRR
jgi:hypothetical protein